MDVWGRFLYSQYLVRLPTPTADFTGQTIIVTGSNTGLGLEAARLLVRLHAAKVILGVRSLEKGQAAAADVLASVPGTEQDAVEVWPLDLANPASIDAFAKRASTELKRLDAVIQNAGILFTDEKKFALIEATGGDETHIAVNVVGAVLLGLRLLPQLRATAKELGVPGRLTFVTSDTMYIVEKAIIETDGSIFEALNKPGGIEMGWRYGISKLLLVYAAREIAARSPVNDASNVIISTLTPGLCKSNLFRDEQPWHGALFYWVFQNLISRSTVSGAGALVDAVRPDLGKEAHGAFLMDCKVSPNGKNVDCEDGALLQEKFVGELWAKLEALSSGSTGVLRS